MTKPLTVVASVPYTDTTAPIMAPALFKGILESAGFDCVAIDLSGQIYNRISTREDYNDYLKFFYHQEVVNAALVPKLKELFEYMADEILKHNPTTVCLSLLHYQCQHATKWLCFLLKKINPNIVIIIGGAGAFGHGLTTNEEKFTSVMMSQGLIDHYISGDGDIALVELLKGNVNYPGVDSLTWQPLEDLNSVAYPNYDDYDFSLYQSPFIGILGSRGCVRQCTFCDIHEYWEKFKYRTGEHIFNEIMYQNKKYGIRYFKFQDSLINGNVKEYNKLIFLLSEHNNKNPDNRIHWASYFIFRPKSQMPEEQWRLTAESGAIRLKVGIESLVEKNRHHIKKKFSNEDIEYSLEMAKKYNISLSLLVLVGYVTETNEDHELTLKWLEDHKHYATDPIKLIAIGGTLSILPGTWLDRHQDELGITWNQGNLSSTGGNNTLWEIKATGNNYKTRLSRMNDLIKVGQQHGYNIKYSVIDPQKELENEIAKQMGQNEYEV